MKKEFRNWVRAKRSRQVAVVRVSMALIYLLSPLDFIANCGRGICDAWLDVRDNVREVRKDLWTLVDEKSP